MEASIFRHVTQIEERKPITERLIMTSCVFFFFFFKERLSPRVRSGIHGRVAPGGALPASRVEGVIWRGVGGVPRGGERGGEWGGPEVKSRDRDWNG